jgi:hypothetical protein
MSPYLQNPFVGLRQRKPRVVRTLSKDTLLQPDEYSFEREVLLKEREEIQKEIALGNKNIQALSASGVPGSAQTTAQIQKEVLKLMEKLEKLSKPKRKWTMGLKWNAAEKRYVRYRVYYDAVPAAPTPTKEFTEDDAMKDGEASVYNPATEDTMTHE